MNNELLINKRTAYADYLAQCKARDAKEIAILDAIEALREQVYEFFNDEDRSDIEQAMHDAYRQALVAEHPSSKDAKVGDYVTCIVENATYKIKFGYSYKVTAISNDGNFFGFDEASMSVPASWFVLGVTPQAEIFY